MKLSQSVWPTTVELKFLLYSLEKKIRQTEFCFQTSKTTCHRSWSLRIFSSWLWTSPHPPEWRWSGGSGSCSVQCLSWSRWGWPFLVRREISPGSASSHSDLLCSPTPPRRRGTSPPPPGWRCLWSDPWPSRWRRTSCLSPWTSPPFPPRCRGRPAPRRGRSRCRRYHCWWRPWRRQGGDGPWLDGSD